MTQPPQAKKSTLNNHIIMRTQKQTLAGPGPGLILVAALIGVPLLEIALFIEVGGRLGLGPTLALIVLGAVIGALVVRQQGIGVLTRARRQLAAGTLPVAEAFEGLCLAIAGALLVLPGFFSDAIGALLLIPALRRGLYRQVRRRLEPQLFQGPDDFPRGSVHGSTSGPTIEGDFEEVEDNRSLRSGDGGDMPPPAGRWGGRR
jgi:UPF0716 protein FxsA